MVNTRSGNAVGQSRTEQGHDTTIGAQQERLRPEASESQSTIQSLSSKHVNRNTNKYDGTTRAHVPNLHAAPTATARKVQ